jgi:membrane peptidoglycan carboxypeptidase
MRAQLALLAALAVTASGCARMVQVEPVGEIELSPQAETSVVVAADGSPLAQLHAEQDRDLVPLDRIPGVLQDAVVAVEDARFWEHAGVDARAVARAVVQNAREGRVVQGGSTITQQLAKNAVTGDETSLDRKLAEASVALQLEAQLSKAEILERYLNTVYFGNGAYGAQTAARRYFGVDVERLRLEQAALLAGLLRAPSRYDPWADPDVAQGRRDLVLRLMGEQGLASAQEVADAQAAPLGLAPPPRAQRWQAPYFVAHVLKLLQHDPEFAVLGLDPVARADRLFRGGLRVETTLDVAWQDAAEAAVTETLTGPDDPRAAVVAIDPDTGRVRALVGGRDFYDPDDPHARFNLATDGARQPGSAFKPLVLATALAQGGSLDDVHPGGASVAIPVRGAQEPWEVSNADGRNFGPMTLRTATQWSVNVVYARLMAELGPEAVVRTAQAAGIRRPLQPYLSLALGAQEVSPLELASVQATLAAGGVYREPTFVTRITAPNGTVLYERGAPQGERVMDDAVAWQVTSALQEVVLRGTGQRADLQRPLAGKTGTSQDAADAWFAGYTPALAAAVWIGFPEGRIGMRPPRTRAPVEGGTWPAELFARFGLRALADVPADDFALPEMALARVQVDLTRDCLPNPYTPPEVVGERAYLAGTEPTQVCREPAGPPTADVPSVVGLSVEAAVGLLHEEGFAVAELPEHSVQLPPGYVMRQSPEAGAGQTLDDGWTVTVWVSVSSRHRVAVPDVLGERLTDARAALEAAGFVVEVAQACPDGTQECTGARQLPGRVWEQAPDAGTQAPAHSVIHLSAYPSG